MCITQGAYILSKILDSFLLMRRTEKEKFNNDRNVFHNQACIAHYLKKSAGDISRFILMSL